MSARYMTRDGREALRRWALLDVSGEAGALDELGEDVICLLDELEELEAELARLRARGGT